MPLHIGDPVVWKDGRTCGRTDGHVTITSLSKFLGLREYQICLISNGAPLTRYRVGSVKNDKVVGFWQEVGLELEGSRARYSCYRNDGSVYGKQGQNAKVKVTLNLIQLTAFNFETFPFVNRRKLQ